MWVQWEDTKIFPFEFQNLKLIRLYEMIEQFRKYVVEALAAALNVTDFYRTDGSVIAVIAVTRASGVAIACADYFRS